MFVDVRASSVNDLPVRKNIRLKDYDYSQNGAYFITVCAKDHLELFASIDVVGAAICRPHLTNVGEAIENALFNVPKIYNNVAIEKYVIMPNLCI
jgi:hypothetical protein